MSEVMSQEEVEAKLAAMKLAAKQALEDAKNEKARLAAEAKAQKQQLREAKKIEQERLKAEKLAAKEASKTLEQNGVRRPNRPGICLNAWNIFDEMSKNKGAPISISEVKSNPASAEISVATLSTQYANWRKYYGISGKIVSEDRAAEKAAKLAEKEALKVAKAEATAAKKAEKETLKLAKVEASAAKQAEKNALKMAKAEAAAAKIAEKMQAKLDAINAAKAKASA